MVFDDEPRSNYRVPFPQPALDLAAPDFNPPPPPEFPLDRTMQELIYELSHVALNPQAWTPFLKRLTLAFNATAAQVALYDFRRGAVLLHAFSSPFFEVPAKIVGDYEEQSPADERAPLAAAFPLRALTSACFDPEKVKDFSVIKFTPPDLGQMMVINDPFDPYWGLIGLLRHRDGERFTRQDQARMAALAAPFAASMATFRSVEPNFRQQIPMQDVMAASSEALGLFTTAGETVFINEAARQALGIDASNQVSGLGDLQQKITQNVTAKRSSFSFALPEGRTIRAHIARLGDDDKQVILRFGATPGTSRSTISGFCAHHKLTEAECEVVAGLVDGETLATIAAKRGTSLETCRSQMRSIREKTGLAGQVEVIAAALQFRNVSVNDG